MSHERWKRPADDDEAIVLALKHPLRRVILCACAEGVHSPRQLSDRLDESLPQIAYHTRALKFYGVIELVETSSVRGATQHFYKANELGRRAVDLAEATGMLERRRGPGGGRSH